MINAIEELSSVSNDVACEMKWHAFPIPHYPHGEEMYLASGSRLNISTTYYRIVDTTTQGVCDWYLFRNRDILYPICGILHRFSGLPRIYECKEGMVKGTHQFTMDSYDQPVTGTSILSTYLETLLGDVLTDLEDRYEFGVSSGMTVGSMYNASSIVDNVPIALDDYTKYRNKMMDVHHKLNHARYLRRIANVGVIAKYLHEHLLYPDLGRIVAYMENHAASSSKISKWSLLTSVLGSGYLERSELKKLAKTGNRDYYSNKGRVNSIQPLIPTDDNFNLLTPEISEFLLRCPVRELKVKIGADASVYDIEVINTLGYTSETIHQYITKLCTLIHTVYPFPVSIHKTWNHEIVVYSEDRVCISKRNLCSYALASSGLVYDYNVTY